MPNIAVISYSKLPNCNKNSDDSQQNMVEVEYVVLKSTEFIGAVEVQQSECVKNASE